NGAGKTTLVNLITGFLQPDEGRIVFDRQDVTRLPVYGRIKAGIARSFQLVNLFDALSVLDNVRLAIFSRDNKINQVMRLAERDRGAEEEARAVIGEFGLADKWSVPARGRRRRSSAMSASRPCWAGVKRSGADEGDRVRPAAR